MKKLFVLRLGLGALVSGAALSLFAQTSQIHVVAGASATGGGTASAAAGGGISESEGSPRVVRTASYLYLTPKSVTRARILHAEAVHRGDAIRRERAREAARATNNVATNVTTKASTTENSTANVNNTTTTPSPLAFNYPAFQIQRPLVRTNISRTNVTASAKSDLPRTLPISEATGPEYNDKDPLLGYQREQAEKGNPESQYAMGVRYLNGTGVDQSDTLARQWLEKASAGGNLKARAKLREMNSAP